MVVIAGIDGNKVKVYDPWPVNIGKIDWRDLDSWYYNGSSASSRDTGMGVRTVLLHCGDRKNVFAKLVRTPSLLYFCLLIGGV